jgi:hypothetical protein
MTSIDDTRDTFPSPNLNKVIFPLWPSLFVLYQSLFKMGNVHPRRKAGVVHAQQ